MARGWIGRSDGERDLEVHIEDQWGPSRKEKLLRRSALVLVLIMMLIMASFVASIFLQTSVEDSFAIVYSAPTELYIGQLHLSSSGWNSFLTATTMTLRLQIPDWDVNVTRKLTYFNRTSDGSRVDYLRMAPISGQVVRDTSGQRVPFSVSIEIVTPSQEVSELRFLGNGNSFSGTVTNDPGKALVTMVSTPRGVVLMDDKRVDVRNEPQRSDVEYWFLQFTRTKLS